MYKLLNITFKLVLFLTLGIAPLLYYYKIGILTESHALTLSIYHLLIGVIPALAYNLPKFKTDG